MLKSTAALCLRESIKGGFVIHLKNPSRQLQPNLLNDAAENFNPCLASSTMILDVGGRRHKVLKSTVSVFPNTRLGKIVRAIHMEDIFNLCDGYIMDEESGVPEYFFNRNWGRY